MMMDTMTADGLTYKATRALTTRPPRRCDQTRPRTASPIRREPYVPPILHERDLPGPMSLSRLAAAGAMHGLDGHSGYWSEHADTLYGRAQIAYTLMPYSTVACALTALWVWLGDGEFPNTIDVLSRSHYRTPRHGRRVRVFSRKIEREQIVTIGNLRVTTPTRTACDVASMFRTQTWPESTTDRLDGLMDAYGITPDDCLAALDAHPYMATTPRARAFFTALRDGRDAGDGDGDAAVPS